MMTQSTRSTTTTKRTRKTKTDFCRALRRSDRDAMTMRSGTPTTSKRWAQSSAVRCVRMRGTALRSLSGPFDNCVSGRGTSVAVRCQMLR